MRERLAFYTPPLKGMKSYLEMIDLAVEFGLKQVELLNLLDFSVPNLDKAREFKAYADEKGITVPCVSVGIQLMVENVDAKIEILKRYADIAQIVGSPYLHHTIAFSWENPDEVYSHKDEFFEKGIKAVREVYDYAEKIGVRVINEEQGFIFNGKENFQKYINSVGRNVGMVADFGNIQFVDEDLEDLIPSFSDIIVHAHVKDYKALKKGEFTDFAGGYETLHHNKIYDTQLGEGSVNIEKIVDALNKIGYKGTISLETPAVDMENKDIIEKNIRYMERLLSK